MCIIRSAFTQAFDSFIQLLCFAYVNSEAFRRAVEAVDTTNNNVCTMIQYMTKSGVNASLYKMRVNILKDIFTVDKLPHAICRINAVCSISELVNKVWLSPVITELSACSSDRCPMPVRTFTHPVLNVHFNAHRGIDQLEEALLTSIQGRTTKCYSAFAEYVTLKEEDFVLDETVSDWPLCSGCRTRTMSCNNDYIFIECTVEGRRFVDANAKLCEVPQFLSIRNANLSLMGVIGYVGGKSALDVGHWVRLFAQPAVHSL